MPTMSRVIYESNIDLIPLARAFLTKTFSLNLNITPSMRDYEDGEYLEEPKGKGLPSFQLNPRRTH